MMLKIDEINDPTSCLSKAGLDERIFVLIGRDVAAPETIRYWCAKRIQLGKNREGDPQIIEALQCAERMEKERGAVVASVGCGKENKQ